MLKDICICLLIICSLIFSSSLFASKIDAQTPSIYTRCNEISPNEYHSLRPYQKNASCTTYDTNFATFCGNELTIRDTIEVSYPGNADLCRTSGEYVYCTYNQEVNKPVEINLDEADLPIMGNTGDEGEVVNYFNLKDNEQFTDAYKMSEYVSWYLEGVVNKKEYENPDESSIANYAGVVAKLLPRQIQEAARIETINEAKTTRHNQIVVCSQWSLAQGSHPVDCHDFIIVDDLLDKEWRLDDWNGTFAFNRFLDQAIDSFSLLIPSWLSLGKTEIKELFLEQSPWVNKTPPLPWENNPATGEPFDSLTYRKAYNEWQGQYCLIVPVIDSLVCLNNVLVPDKVANLFPYIPLSSTEDVEGEILIDTISSATNTDNGGVSLTDVSFGASESAKLYFSHLEETNQLGSLLQDTYVPKGESQMSSPTNIDTSEASCQTVEVRSNAGDDLFATSIRGNLHYKASFTCQYNKVFTQDELDPCLQGTGSCVPNDWACDGLAGGICKKGYKCATFDTCQLPAQTCTKNVYINLSTQSKIPVIDDVWSRLVAGSMSVVKRIFPKTNTENFGKLLDIPGSTNISYEGTDIDVTQSTTDLKIPHVGGISEYFLKGIQTALRPKGFGESLTFADSDNGEGVVDGINCNQSVAELNVPGLNKDEATRISNDWYGPGVGKAYFEECNNDVIQTANSKGVNPIFALAIWIHESGASNYIATTPVEDFGIHNNSSAPPNDFTAQLNFFLNLPDAYSSCGTKDMNTFISMFWFGHCTPQNSTEEEMLTQYITEIQWIYSIIAPSVTLPSWPK